VTIPAGTSGQVGGRGLWIANQLCDVAGAIVRRRHGRAHARRTGA
jgi:hypothetical protein